MTIVPHEIQLDELAARQLTNRIATLVEGIENSLDTLSGLIIRAYGGNAHRALGYATWQEYVDAELKTNRLRLTREERQAVVMELTEAGMGKDTIAASTGVAKSTVENIRKGPDSGPPAEEPQDDTEDDVVDGEIVDEEPEPKPKKRRPLKESVTEALSDIVKASDRLARLMEDDRFEAFSESGYSALAYELTTAIAQQTEFQQIMKMER